MWSGAVNRQGYRVALGTCSEPLFLIGLSPVLNYPVKHCRGGGGGEENCVLAPLAVQCLIDLLHMFFLGKTKLQSTLVLFSSNKGMLDHSDYL